MTVGARSTSLPSLWSSRAARTALIAWSASRLLYLMIGFGAAAVLGAGRVFPQDEPLPGAALPFRLYNRLDSGHFLRIARDGYFHLVGGRPAWDEAFFPGYPLASRGLAKLIGLGHPGLPAYLAAMSVVAWAAAFAAATLLWQNARADDTTEIADISVWILLLGPYSVFLVASYSESLFLAFALAAWMLAREQRWILAAVLAAAAAAVRINGVFLAVGLAVMFWQHRRRADRSSVRIEAVLLVIPLIAPFAYFGWLAHKSGSWTTWFDEERIAWVGGRPCPGMRSTRVSSASGKCPRSLNGSRALWRSSPRRCWSLGPWPWPGRGRGLSSPTSG